MEKTAEFIQLARPEDRVPLLCRTVERHYLRGNTVAVHLPDEAEAAELDQTLWTFRQNSFIPHVRLAAGEEPLLEPVLIACAGEQLPQSDVVVVASRTEPERWIGRFDYICDFAEVYDEKLRSAARERFAAYKAAGRRMRYIK